MAKNRAPSYEQARVTDIPAIQQLLQRCTLPADDVGEHIHDFLVARVGGRLVGVVGLERSGPTAVVRSLAVDADLRGLGIGKELYRRIVAYAKVLGVRELGLLTTTAEGFFAKAGFGKCVKDAVPEYIRVTKEFRFYCPSTAVCMTKSIDLE